MDGTVAPPVRSASGREHRAERCSEGLERAATLLSPPAIAAVGIAVIDPLARRRLDLFADGGRTSLIAAIVLHPMGQIMIRFRRPED
ncbi:hypothetical protein LOK46_24780 [Methylobacterium sp. NMS14P]|uniref:hypothetical protein n=1 Tax=Methylobacterium sp. NMS14P TaxID=2894310 RepID=UPI002359D028|nr:hypothetical protein [Methylobacterium sp. NMS14P]WCS24317.1 hypothetical protein LOK46_24780 [Methylobacterium sp. NMS14P]